MALLFLFWKKLKSVVLLLFFWFYKTGCVKFNVNVFVVMHDKTMVPVLNYFI